MTFFYFVSMKMGVLALFIAQQLWLPALVGFLAFGISYGSDFRPKTEFRFFVGIILLAFAPVASYYGWLWQKDDNSIVYWTVDRLSEGYLDFGKRLEDKKTPERIVEGTELRRYELVNWNPPKHFYVALEDVETHQVYQSLYVSKHCTTSGLAKGQEYNIYVEYYHMSNAPTKRLIEFKNLYGVFCSG